MRETKREQICLASHFALCPLHPLSLARTPLARAFSMCVCVLTAPTAEAGLKLEGAWQHEFELLQFTSLVQ